MGIINSPCHKYEVFNCSVFIDQFIFRSNFLGMRLPWECHDQSQESNWRHRTETAFLSQKKKYTKNRPVCNIPVTVNPHPNPGKHGALATKQNQGRIMPYIQGTYFESNPYQNEDNLPHKGDKEAPCQNPQYYFVISSTFPAGNAQPFSLSHIRSLHTKNGTSSHCNANCHILLCFPHDLAVNRDKECQLLNHHLIL